MPSAKEQPLDMRLARSLVQTCVAGDATGACHNSVATHVASGLGVHVVIYSQSPIKFRLIAPLIFWKPAVECLAPLPGRRYIDTPHPPGYAVLLILTVLFLASRDQRPASSREYYLAGPVTLFPLLSSLLLITSTTLAFPLRFRRP